MKGWNKRAAARIGLGALVTLTLAIITFIGWQVRTNIIAVQGKSLAIQGLTASHENEKCIVQMAQQIKSSNAKIDANQTTILREVELNQAATMREMDALGKALLRIEDKIPTQ